MKDFISVCVFQYCAMLKQELISFERFDDYDALFLFLFVEANHPKFLFIFEPQAWKLGRDLFFLWLSGQAVIMHK